MEVYITRIKHRILLPAFAAALLFLHFTGIINSEPESEEAVAVVSEANNVSVLIIDPGHGGADGGAVAPDGTLESVLNLEIALKLDDLSHFFGIKTVLTRDSELLDYPDDISSIAEMKRWDQHRRLEIINSAGDAVFISIHQNKYPDSKPYGPQVLYGEAVDSELLGKSCHEYLNVWLCPENRRVASPALKDIYLIKNANCTSILVECGFLSNSDDLSKLKENDYQKKLASILLAVYLNHT